MISISHEAKYTHAVVFEQFTLQDYKEFEDNVLYDIRFHGAARLLLDLRLMDGYTIDMALEEIRFSKKNRQNFDRVAVVSDDQWVVWSVWLNQAISESEIKVFADITSAQQWLEYINIAA
ncbi:STAS/SEC14 domain-containing protein [uncultured Deefgea sp.]|uniref:STAS/SEC14 domain-containing protein n=1 Tax=uncultured Deefgea sp. TaxID=1304914 RepID=UPI0026357BB5|nr:STAS/SEC14 domain-containing protein [uncultured Deefgea sp.]